MSDAKSQTAPASPVVWWDGEQLYAATRSGSHAVLFLDDDGEWYREQPVATPPADAVQLVPESDVEFVLDENERHLAQHAEDVAEIGRLRSELDHADHFGRGEFRVTSWAYEQVCRTDREKSEKIAALMQEVAELRAGAVTDTGQARADHLAAGIRKFADDCKLLLDSGGLDNRVVRSVAQQERNLRALLAADSAPEPSGYTDTRQASR